MMNILTTEDYFDKIYEPFWYNRKSAEVNTEAYRSGHNGADSKSVREQSPASSNLAASARN